MGAEQSKASSHYDEKRSAAVAEMTSAATSSSRISQQQLSKSLAKLSLDKEQIEKIHASYAPISSDSLERYSKDFWDDNKNRLALNAVVGNDPTNVLVNRSEAIKANHVFNVKIDVEGKITNQRSSGRCWLFAGTNVLRLAVIEKFKLDDDFELSQSYLFFYGMDDGVLWW